MVTKGIDISHYDPQCNWPLIKADGVDFVYIKATQGIGFADPLCNTHATNAKAQGIKVGYYHFADVNADAIAEANFFCAQLNKLPASDLLPVLDIESNKSGLSASEIETWILTFENTMLALGHKIMLYSYAPFLDQYLPKTHQFGRLPLWIAQYRNITAPILPHGWTAAAVWQYTNQGHVNGISVLVDMNKPMAGNFEI